MPNVGPHNKNQGKAFIPRVKNELAHHSAKSTAARPSSRLEQ